MAADDAVRAVRRVHPAPSTACRLRPVFCS